MGLLLADTDETLAAVVGRGASAHHVRVRDLPAAEGALWRAFSDAEDVRVLEDAFPHSGWEFLVAVERASCSQFDVLRERLGRDLSPPGPVACLALEGREFHGHRGRAWSARRGNLHLSVALEPALPAATHALAFTMLPALAAVDAIGHATGGAVEPRIKWVNDVLVGGSKVAGVLTATQTGGATLDLVVMGVGLNVASSPELPASPFVSSATSLADEDPASAPTLAEVVPALLDALGSRYALLRREGPSALFEAYRARSLVLGREVRIYGEDVAITADPAAWPEPLARGRVTDLEADLSLGLQGVSGRVRTGRLAFEEACRAFGLA